MKLSKLSVLSVLLGGIITSCAPKAYQAKEVPAVGDMVIINTVANVGITTKKDGLIIDDRQSELAGHMVDDLLLRKLGVDYASKMVRLDEDARRQELFSDIMYRAERMEKDANYDSLGIPLLIEQILDANRVRYGMVSVLSCFTRKVNYIGHMGTDVMIGGVSLGMSFPITPKSECSLITVIFDNEAKKMVYYKSASKSDGDPTNHRHLDKLLDRTLKDYAIE